MPISLFSPTGRLRASLVDGQPRQTLTDQASPGDVLTICECSDLGPHPTADDAGRCPGRVLSVRFEQAGPAVEPGPKWR